VLPLCVNHADVWPHHGKRFDRKPHFRMLWGL
jgi:hypothetical protein